MNIIPDNLNREQKMATECTDGPLLVLSGAGTGKTRVLISRISYILSLGLAMPWQILALTFTNKAANEMKARIAQTGNTNWNVSDLWCGTFHSICLRILRANSGPAGLRPDFLVFGEDDQKAVIKTVLVSMGFDIKEYSPADWVEKISSIKDKGANYKPDGNTKKIYDAYNAELTRMNAIDFGDIILKVLNLFCDVPDVLKKYQRQFKYIMVDEFQDTNNAQHELLLALSEGYGNICCVGDDDQSIYSWRGAEIAHILGFEKNYPGAKIIRLETNYRSTGNILNAANSLIRKNTGRLGKDLRTPDGTPDGEKVYVLTLGTDWDEVRMISTSILSLVNNNNYNNFAVLIRAGSLSRLLEEEFTTRRIPYRLVGATKFYDRMEIRDVIAYLRLLVHPFDDLSFIRVIAKPRRGFGDIAISKLRDFGGNLMSALRAAPLPLKMRQGADEFLSAFDFDWSMMKPNMAAQQLLDKSGYINMLKTSKESDAPDRLANVKELIGNVISKYDTLNEFLEHASLMMTDEMDDDKYDNNAVNIMTIHAAKGLEFETVFLPAWEEGIFPTSFNESKVVDIEEERRLAYVAITRARNRAIITNAASRMIFGQRQYNSPSRFISEIDAQFIKTQGDIEKQTVNNYSKKPKKYQQPKNISSVGKLANHPDMGRGVIIEDSGDILTIAFRDNGIKKIDRRFITISD